MNYLDALWTVLRWKRDGWDVHPVNLKNEFSGWF
jgi:hypothetical protein